MFYLPQLKPKRQNDQRTRTSDTGNKTVSVPFIRQLLMVEVVLSANRKASLQEHPQIAPQVEQVIPAKRATGMCFVRRMEVSHLRALSHESQRTWIVSIRLQIQSLLEICFFSTRIPANRHVDRLHHSLQRPLATHSRLLTISPKKQGMCSWSVLLL